MGSFIIASLRSPANSFSRNASSGPLADDRRESADGSASESVSRLEFRSRRRSSAFRTAME